MNSVGMYARLSVEDREKYNDDSRSIGNQIDLITDYCKKHGYNIYDTYIDDGISGMERNRPAFQRLLKDCEEGRVDMVICKDMSRFSRDDVIIKEYLHEKFFIWHVRFIGISDNVDSESPDFMDNSSMRGFFNEWYIRDCSKKVRAVFESKKQQGKYCHCAPYGYIKDPLDNNHLIPDPNTRDIVVRIYESYVSGMSYAKIAEMLNAEGIPSPTAYKTTIYPNYQSRYKDNVWSADGIKNILRNEVYIGNTLLGKSEKIGYRKDAKTRCIPKEKWVRTENTHEPIISQELWEQTRPRISSPSRASRDKVIQPLSGKVICGCCGKAMVRKVGRGRVNKVDGSFKKYSFYRCPDVMKGKCTCTNTRQISYLNLQSAIIKAINDTIKAYCDNDELRIDEMQGDAVDKLAKQYQQISDKKAVVQRRLDKIYTDKLDDIITTDEYLRYKEQFTAEIDLLNKKLSEVSEKLTQLEQRRANNEYLDTLIAKYTNITELTRQLTEDFLDSVVVGTANEHGEREVTINLRI